MKTFKSFSHVRLIQPVIEGRIIAGHLSDDGESVDYEVEYDDPATGETRTRHFNSEQLELTEEQPDDAGRERLREEHLARRAEQHERDVAQGQEHEEAK